MEFFKILFQYNTSEQLLHKQDITQLSCYIWFLINVLLVYKNQSITYKGKNTSQIEFLSYRKCTLNIWDTFCIGFHIFKKMSICFFCASLMKGNNSWILTSLNLYMKQQLHIHTFRFLIASLTISVPFALSTSHSPRNYIKKNKHITYYIHFAWLYN